MPHLPTEMLPNRAGVRPASGEAWGLPGLLAPLVIAMVLARGTVCEARSLLDTLTQLTTFTGVTVPSNVTRAALDIQRSAVRTSDFVATATTPGFFFRFDLELGAPERVSLPGGAIFVEPAYTIGARRFDFSLGYQYAEFTELDGKPLEDVLDELDSAERNTFIDIETTEFALRSHVWSFSLTYGLTERWDINVLLPLLLTSLDLRGGSQVLVDFVPFFRSSVDASEGKFGVGDILLRTKYRLPDLASFNFASILTLRAPSGEEENFQGLGDVVVTPALAVTRSLGRYELHSNVGLDLNADDLERNRIRYGLGATGQVAWWLTLFADLIGSSAFQDDRVTEHGIEGEVSRTDIVDVAAGIKLSMPGEVLVYLAAIVPVTSDGLRPQVVPTGGVEVAW